MKPGNHPPPPDDDASDPLLAALRQRLGDYGQAPPPAAWAAIRQRLPPARPWWRRPRRILPLLALLLSFITIGLLTVRQPELASSARPRGHRGPGAQALASRPPGQAKTKSTSTDADGYAAREPLPMAATQPTAKPLPLLLATAPAAPATTPAAPQKATSPAAFSKQPALAKKGFLGQASDLKKRTSTTQQAAAHVNHSSVAAAASAPAAGLAFTSPSHRRTRERIAYKAAPIARRQGASRGYLGSRSATAATGHQPIFPALPTGRVAIMPARPTAKTPAYLAYATPKKQRANHPYSHLHTLAQAAAPAARRYPPALAAAPAPLRARPKRSGQHRASTLVGTSIPAETSGTTPVAPPYLASAAGPPVDSLVLGRPALVLTTAALPAALRATPDSVRPGPPPVRRWSVLLVAGPTLSYRTLGPVPTLAAGQPDFARLERPALGFGAQVQVRRVLSGRWALAVGLGYHEYATRLALTRKDTAYTSVHQRDTYRLLTVPVQLSYALHVPRGRLSWALLAGAEPGWYQGGRSTEGSTCSCQQQAYSSAAASPYRSLSLAFSLGLDLRYRLGSPSARWQWLVQPTGRYVATPFVRSDAVGFTQRQPFSLGFLTGFSWDVH